MISAPGKGPHLSEDQVGAIVAALDQAEGDRQRDLMTRLAWRPAWAIRSRRGAWRAFLSLLRGGVD